MKAWLALAAATCTVPALAAPCVGPVCNFELLSPVFAKLAAARGARGQRPVHILQIGDSHTAGDAITGAWRELLQAKAGSGGRGVLAAGRPYDGYLTRGVTASMSPGWSVAATFGRGWSSEAHPPLGLAGFSLTSTQPGAMIGLAAEPGEMFDRVVLCAIARADAGALLVRIGAEPEQRLEFDSATERPECRTLKTALPQAQLQVTAERDPVTITSWATFRDDGGLALSNVGVVGSQLVHFSRTDDAVLAEELRTYRPDLIVLAFGTNESFAPNFAAFSYEVTLRTQVGRLRRLAGNVPILLLGAPDALSRQAVLRTNAPGRAVDCQPLPAPVAAMTPVNAVPDTLAAAVAALREQAAAEGADVTGLTNAPVPASPPPPPQPARGLFAPPAAAQLRDVQRRIAGQLNLAYWDWNARMGGPCAAQAWVRSDPARMRGDYIHFTSTGGREVARLLEADLDRAAGAR